MKSTRRILAAVGLAAGVTGLAAPLANACDGCAPEDDSLVQPIAMLDSLTVSQVPAAYQHAIPLPSSQLTGLERLNDQLYPVTDPVAAPASEAISTLRN